MQVVRRYGFGVLLLIIAIVLIVVGFNFVRGLFRNDPARQQEETAKRVNLLDAANSNRTVRYTINGSIVGNEEHRVIRITVDGSTRRAEVIQGYSSQVIKSQETPNTPEAYRAFIAAINGAGFTNTVAPQGRGDEAQSCPLGRKYAYELDPGAQGAFRTWNTSCSRSQGTFTGNTQLIQTLFQKQVPEYGKFTYGVQLTP